MRSVPRPSILRRGAGGDDAVVSRLGWKLAALTSLLLIGLVVAMGAAIYVKAGSDMLQPIRSIAQSRASEDAGQLIRPSGAQGSFRGHGGLRTPPQSRQRPPGNEPVIGGVFAYDLGPNLKVITSSSGGPRGRRVPSPQEARDVLDDREADFTTITVRGVHYLVYTRPVVRGNTLLGIVQVATPLTEYDNGREALLKVLVLVGLLGVIAAMGITVLVVRRAMRPIQVSMRRQRDFVADAAHELRTPLTILRSVAESGIGRGDAEEQQRAEMTLHQTMHLTRLVSDLSLLARADTGKLDFALAPVALDLLLAQVVDDALMLAEDRGVHMRSDIAPDVTVQGDTDRLRQLLLILLDNALKYSPRAGTVSVQLGVSRREAMLRVLDEGPGIDPQDLPHIFERFYRSDRSRTGDGTGLGLAIADSITQAHHGRITAENRSGSGAVFTVVLPLLDHRGALERDSAPTLQGASGRS